MLGVSVVITSGAEWSLCRLEQKEGKMFSEAGTVHQDPLGALKAGVVEDVFVESGEMQTSIGFSCEKQTRGPRWPGRAEVDQMWLPGALLGTIRSANASRNRRSDEALVGDSPTAERRRPIRTATCHKPHCSIRWLGNRSQHSPGPPVNLP